MNLPIISPRIYQVPVRSALQRGYRRIVKTWPRRSGKDLDDFQSVVERAIQHAGNYYYMFPTRAWATRALWENMPEWTNGRNLIDVLCPDEIVDKKNNSDYFIRLKNGARIQIDGTDNMNFIGQGGSMYVLSEFQSHKEEVTGFLAPILRESDAPVVFNGTLRGKNNQLWKFYEDNVGREGWYTQWLTLHDTKTDYWISEADGICVNPELIGKTSPYTGKPFTNIQDEVDSGMISFAMARQEFLNEAMSFVAGAYYTREMELIEGEGRTDVRYDGHSPVYTFWDLGGDKEDSDTTAITFAEINVKTKEAKIIDYYENTGHLRGHYFDMIKSKPYRYGGHYVPHDGKRSNTFTGEGMAQTARRLHNVDIRYVPKASSVSNEIEITRRQLTRTSINVSNSQNLVDHLTKYHENEATGKPCHKNNCSVCKGASHGADTVRLMSMAIDIGLVEPYLSEERPKRRRTQIYDDYIIT